MQSFFQGAVAGQGAGSQCPIMSLCAGSTGQELRHRLSTKMNSVLSQIYARRRSSCCKHLSAERPRLITMLLPSFVLSFSLSDPPPAASNMLVSSLSGSFWKGFPDVCTRCKYHLNTTAKHFFMQKRKAEIQHFGFLLEEDSAVSLPKAVVQLQKLFRMT